jgi:hypothetical protein
MITARSAIWARGGFFKMNAFEMMKLRGFGESAITYSEFIALNQINRQWYDMCAAPNGDIYACALFGDIYKQTGGQGNFIALNQAYREWYGMCAAPNGDVYVCALSGDIYKMTLTLT